MDLWMYGCVGGWVGGQMNKWIEDGWVRDGWMEEGKSLHSLSNAQTRDKEAISDSASLPPTLP